MDLFLKRKEFRDSGIFGELHAASPVDGGLVALTLEHAYENGTGDGIWMPKVPKGTYRCVLGQHMLHSGPITTFMLKDVPGHQGILIHPGNTESASEGCILVGTGRMGNALTQSRDAFEKFMALQAGCTEFSLNVY